MKALARPTPARVATIAVNLPDPGRGPSPLPRPESLPPILDIVTAGRLLGIGRTTAYQLARNGNFPVPVLRIGGGYKVPTAPLLTLLGIEAPTPAQAHARSM